MPTAGERQLSLHKHMSTVRSPLPCRMRPALAMSQDGRNWARIEGSHHSGALLDVGEEGDWDAAMACAPQVPPRRPAAPEAIRPATLPPSPRPFNQRFAASPLVF